MKRPHKHSLFSHIIFKKESMVYDMEAFYRMYKRQFKDIYGGMQELTVVEEICGIIPKVIAIVAELTGGDNNELIRQIIEDNKKLQALQSYANTA